MTSEAFTKGPAEINLPSEGWHARQWIKLVIGLILAGLVLGGLYWLFFSAAGAEVRDDPPELGRHLKHLIRSHPFAGPAIFVGIYVLAAVIALPVWPLQVAAGFSFGIAIGWPLSLLACTAGAVITVFLSRWLAGDWFHSRIETRMDKLRRLDETMGHNGLLVVVTVRLIHLLPFGVCNYALGITKVNLRDVLVGTAMGSLPAVGFYVGMGAFGAVHIWKHWIFLTFLGVTNVVMLIPLALRYVVPRWFADRGI